MNLAEMFEKQYGYIAQLPSMHEILDFISQHYINQALWFIL